MKWEACPSMTFFKTPDGGPFFQIRNYFMFHLLYRLSTSVTLESEHTGALLVTCRKNRNIFMCLLNILMQMPSCTVWKNEKFSLTEKKFRQINYLVISLVKPLLSRNFFEKVWERISAISTLWRDLITHCGIYDCITVFWKISVKTTSLVETFTVKLISRNNSQVIQKFVNSTLHCRSLMITVVWKNEKFEKRNRWINLCMLCMYVHKLRFIIETVDFMKFF